jgi:hypothetical protein
MRSSRSLRWREAEDHEVLAVLGWRRDEAVGILVRAVGPAYISHREIVARDLVAALPKAIQELEFALRKLVIRASILKIMVIQISMACSRCNTQIPSLKSLSAELC